MTGTSRQLPAHLLPAPEWAQGGWWNPSGYRSADVRARVLYLFLAAEFVAHLVAGSTYLFLADAGASGSISPRETGGVILGVAVVFLISLLVTLGSFIAMLAWLSRSVDNSWYLLGGNPEWSPGWSIGWWFIPFANIVMPLLVILDLNKRMARGIGSAGTALVIAWWVVRVVLPMLAYIPYFANFSVVVGAPGERPDPGEILRLFGLVFGLTELSHLIPIALQWVVVRRIQRHAEARAPYAIPPPPPVPPMPMQWPPPPGWNPAPPPPPPPPAGASPTPP